MRVCESCGKSFVYKGNFKNHARLCTKDKRRFACVWCQKVFVKSGNRNRHLKICKEKGECSRKRLLVSRYQNGLILTRERCE
jgi:hypothetical protein